MQRVRAGGGAEGAWRELSLAPRGSSHEEQAERIGWNGGGGGGIVANPVR
jgi:hypothetical protein